MGIAPSGSWMTRTVVKAVAKRVGLKTESTRQTINALENARYNPSLLLAFKITKILGKESIEDVFILKEED